MTALVGVIITTFGLSTMITTTVTTYGELNCEEDSSGYLCQGGSGSQGGGFGTREQCDFDENTCEASGGTGGENRGTGAGHNNCDYDEETCEFRGKGGYLECTDINDEFNCDYRGEGH